MKLILMVYLFTVIAGFIIMKISEAALKARYEREHGFKKVRQRQSFAEKIMSYLPLFIPIFNLIFIFVPIFCLDNLYKKYNSEDNSKD